MAYSKTIAASVEKKLAGLGEIRTKKMFGALAIYCDDVLFAAVMNDNFTLKVTDSLISIFEENGMERHVFDDRPIKMPYYNVSTKIIDDQKELHKWALQTINHIKIKNRQC